MIDTKQKEVWKTYPEFPFIEVSNLGRIRTKDHYVPGKNGSKRLIKGRVLKQQLSRNGYMRVSFRVNGKIIHLSVHRMVAVTLIPNPNNLPEVNHIDCDRTNNRMDNLEWCTRQENIKYCVKLGHWKNNNPGRPVIAIDLNNLKVFWFESQREAEHQLGVFQASISRVVNSKQKQTHGYWFCYADENAIEKVRTKFGDEIAHKVEKLIGENYD